MRTFFFVLMCLLSLSAFAEEKISKELATVKAVNSLRQYVDENIIKPQDPRELIEVYFNLNGGQVTDNIFYVEAKENKEMYTIKLYFSNTEKTRYCARILFVDYSGEVSNRCGDSFCLSGFCGDM